MIYISTVNTKAGFFYPLGKVLKQYQKSTLNSPIGIKIGDLHSRCLLDGMSRLYARIPP